MSLKIIVNGIELVLGSPVRVITGDHISIDWYGDESGVVRVLDHNGDRLGEYTMPLAGTSTQVEYSGYVPPTELGQPTTLVKRLVDIERFVDVERIGLERV
jgi:hypothetical protein